MLYADDIIVSDSHLIADTENPAEKIISKRVFPLKRIIITEHNRKKV